jgi:hypothetical protein
MSNASAFDGKRVVLFCDEFDGLYSMPAPVQDSVLLEALRVLKQTPRAGHVLQAFVGIASFSMLEFTGGEKKSPFNVRDTLQVQFFSEEQQCDYNRQYEQRRRVTVDPAVLVDIGALTNGHPGLFALCYKHLDSAIVKRMGDVIM